VSRAPDLRSHRDRLFVLALALLGGRYVGLIAALVFAAEADALVDDRFHLEADTLARVIGRR